MTKTYVLIPGAWHGGWAWHPVAQRLRAAGHRAIALTLPGLAAGDDPRGLRLQDAVDHVVHEIERRDLSDVTLVAHSWGGFPLTGAAYRVPERVAGAVFHSAFVPTRGVSMNEAFSKENADAVRAAIEATADHTVSLTFDQARQLLMQGEPEALQRLVFDLMVPQPGGYMLDALDVEGFSALGIPAAYTLAEDDIALALPGVELAARLGVEPVMTPGTHEAMLTHPDEVAKAVLSV
jgi:pimeloyl-ACP methyl ester carboxylesterase